MDSVPVGPEPTTAWRLGDRPTRDEGALGCPSPWRSPDYGKIQQERAGRRAPPHRRLARVDDVWWTGHRIGIFSLTESRRVTSETEMVDLMLARLFATAHGERAAELKENGR